MLVSLESYDSKPLEPLFYHTNYLSILLSCNPSSSGHKVDSIDIN